MKKLLLDIDALAVPQPSVERPIIRRVTPTSRKGRSMVGAKGAVMVGEQQSELTEEQRRWNAEVEAKKKERR